MARHYTLARHHAPAIQIDYAAELNPQQLEAVQAPPGPALVIAGAGSGKTRTLTYRVAYLLEHGVSPSNILLLTFTNKAARQMLERVEALLPNRTIGLWGGTFHSIGNRILRAHAIAAGFRPGFSIMDREDQQRLLDAVIPDAGINPLAIKEKRFPKGEVIADILSYALNTGTSIEDVLTARYPYFLPFTEEIVTVGSLYEKRKLSANALDFDDLLEKPLRLLEREERIAKAYRSQFQYILVDEYQDTNQLQSDFIDTLALEHQNVMVVGDDAQSIYSWRGANFKNILQFPKRYPEAKVYKIETNYRSVPEVLTLANTAIAANTEQFEKQLQPARAAVGVKPALIPLTTSNEQALFVAQRIGELRDEGIGLNQIAVLYRAHFHSMELQMELTRHGIPFGITSGLRFFEQAHIKDVAAFLKFAVNPRDEVAFKRMAQLLPGIGAGSASKLWNSIEAESALASPSEPVDFEKILLSQKVPAKAKKAWDQLAYTLQEIAPEGQSLPPTGMVNSVVEAVYDDYLRAKFPNYDARREDINTLANYARQYQDTSEFLDQLALMSGIETEYAESNDYDTEQEKVTLSSVHQAKGLEWRAVFIIGMSDGMFPSSRSVESEEGIEEERRLFYVAITRAEDQLYLTYPILRPHANYSSNPVQRPSRFIDEIPKDLLEVWQVSGNPF